jgi:hypothetical protein
MDLMDHENTDLASLKVKDREELLKQLPLNNFYLMVVTRNKDAETGSEDANLRRYDIESKMGGIGKKVWEEYFKDGIPSAISEFADNYYAAVKKYRQALQIEDEAERQRMIDDSKVMDWQKKYENMLSETFLGLCRLAIEKGVATTPIDLNNLFAS